MLAMVQIAIAVDVLGALSAKSLDGYIFMMDSGDCASDRKGTASLVTCCRPGQVVCWRCYAVDLQTPVSIKGIEFLGCCAATARATTPTQSWGCGPTVEGADWTNDSREWKGIVPGSLIPGVDYRYRVSIQMGEGKYSTMAIDTPALRVV